MTIGSDQLRQSLTSHARTYAKRTGVNWYHSRGKSASVLFPATADGAIHGNFAPLSYQTIIGKTNKRGTLASFAPKYRL